MLPGTQIFLNNKAGFVVSYEEGDNFVSCRLWDDDSSCTSRMDYLTVQNSRPQLEVDEALTYVKAGLPIPKWLQNSRRKLTERQQVLLKFCNSYEAKNQNPPSSKEIAKALNLSVSTVNQTIARMWRKGYPVKTQGSNKEFMILDTPELKELRDRSDRIKKNLLDMIFQLEQYQKDIDDLLAVEI